MAKSLADLAKKDPEFFKYLKENDAELLDFEGGENEDEDDDEEVEVTKKTKKDKKEKKTKGKGKEQVVDEDEMMEYDAGSDSEEEPEFGEPEEQKEVEKVSVSMKMLRSWQRAMIEVSCDQFRAWYRSRKLIRNIPDRSITTAKLATITEKDDLGFPSGCSYEPG
jgi:nucleolar complex protein 2